MAKTDKHPPAGKSVPARAPRGKPGAGANKPKAAGKGPKPRTRGQAGR